MSEPAPQSEFHAYQANMFDVEDIVAAAIRFHGESDNAGIVHYNEDKYRSLVTAYICNQYVASFVARDKSDQLIGYIHIYCQDDWTEEMIGEMFQFYVAPEWRGRGVARELVGLADQKWKEWGCKRVYAEAASGVNPQLFCNLYNKFGFKQAGLVMMKEYE